ncbi:mannose-1-phosphate guanylyltransferase/mannose-6-phosphate isomerase [Thalassotalea crassostreae]|uniref:mannose-1-phosphate guanylyltransferase/mannose-6-phosphate isomerase n=1 Tax=Thalassotalea crassostreae TaxID=1763536 RepID=UPI000837EF4E|nr:mannose-1-phosphate guanylyltransferase/mannose-6-phosphate isomerase [Thalassotalea crassostreae]
MITPVILAGGIGSRLWPLSRKLMPKQFLNLTSSESMLQQTLTRLKGLKCGNAITICNEEHRFVVAEQLRSIDSLGKILLEPVGRNTAPAIALAAIEQLKQHKDAVLLVLAADHHIEDVSAFQQQIELAKKWAEQGKMVTFGIVAKTAETGFGYIRAGKALGESAADKDDMSAKCFAIERFVEKPDLATAKQYIESGDYFWNAGIFMFKASRYLEELELHRPDIFGACKSAMANTKSDLDFIRVDNDAFTQCPSDSIDYAVMEKTSSGVVVPLDANWNDVGSFKALWDIHDKDSDNNVHQGDVLSCNSSNNLVIAESKLVATVGVSDTIVVQTKDAILVANKDNVQQVKNIVQQIETLNRPEANIHRQVYRPWGHFDTIDVGSRDLVKRITVLPQHKLSMQKHQHRAEHWVVVSGTAKVTRGEEIFLLTENQSTYIPAGVVHSLENPGKIALEIIEVQSGDYLGEDDIERFKDDYGRA